MLKRKSERVKNLGEGDKTKAEKGDGCLWGAMEGRTSQGGHTGPVTN